MARSTPGTRKTGTKRRILDEARAHFSRVGFEGTSTRAIAKDAGINHSLIVYHFESKEQLWRSVMDDLFAEFTAFAEAIPEMDDPVTQLRHGFHSFARFCARCPELHRIMTIEGRLRTERLDWLIESYLRSNFDRICTLIKAGQETGRIRPGNPAQLYYAMIGIAGTLATLAPEYEELSGESATSDSSVASAIELIDALIFIG